MFEGLRGGSRYFAEPSCEGVTWGGIVLQIYVADNIFAMLNTSTSSAFGYTKICVVRRIFVSEFVTIHSYGNVLP